MVGKIAGVVVGSGSCLESHWRHRRHAQLFPRVVWPETAEVIFLDTARGDHMWNWTLKIERREPGVLNHCAVSETKCIRGSKEVRRNGWGTLLRLMLGLCVHSFSAGTPGHWF